MKNAIRVALALLFAAALAFGMFVYDVHSYGGHAADADGDAAIVLGGAIDGDQPSPIFRERINHAIHLFRTGKVRCIVMTGACPNGCEFAESTIGKRYAIRCGVPEDKILTETKSHTTYQNLYYSRELAREHGLKTFVVVSDPYHLRRAMRMAEELKLDARPSATPTSLLNDAGFLLSETRRNVKYLIHHGLFKSAEADELSVDNH